MSKQPPPPDKLVDIALVRDKEGRLVLRWKVDAEGIQDAARDKVAGEGARAIGSLFDRVFKKKKEE